MVGESILVPLGKEVAAVVAGGLDEGEVVDEELGGCLGSEPVVEARRGWSVVGVDMQPPIVAWREWDYEFKNRVCGSAMTVCVTVDSDEMETMR